MVKNPPSGLPGGKVDKNPPAKKKKTCQCRGHVFDSWSKKIPHALGQQSLRATTTEPAYLEPVLLHMRSHHSEKPRHCSEE